VVKKRIPPEHPGAYLKELLDELALSQYRLAKDIGVPAMRINYVVNGKRPVTAELALRLGRYFGQNPRYRLNIQSRYDMDMVEDAMSDQVARQIRPLAVAVS
jgi:addiction module HigA family antidote